MFVRRASECRRMPWKNGGGVTTEIAVSPQDAGLDDFAWRLSMATVATDGAFSEFPGVDRTLAILEGAGMRLSVDAAAPVDLRRGSAPHAFAADRPASARLVDGEVIDLNIMTRRSRCSHAMRRFELNGVLDLLVPAAETLLFCHEGTVSVDIGSASDEIGALDTLILKSSGLLKPSGDSLRIATSGAATFFLIELGSP